MSGTLNKVDMSLDDIIKLNKKNKKGISPMNRQQGNAKNTRKGNTLKNMNNNKIPGRYSGVNKRPGAGGISKNNNNAILQKKRMNALKKLREAKQALALIDAKKKTFGKPRNQSQNRLPQQNRQQTNNKRNFNNTLPNQIHSNKRPRINRNYGSQTSLNQFNGPLKKKKFTASSISLASVGSTNRGGYQQQSRNNQNNNTRRQPRQRQKQWNKQSVDNSLTVQVNNNRIRQNRNRRNNNKFNTKNLKVQPGKHINYEFDTNVFSNVGTSVPLNERFSSKGQKQHQGNNRGRQVYY